MNKHDSERIAGYLARYGMEPVARATDADVILVNTCYVRERAMIKVRGYVGRLRKLKFTNPDLVLGVCGCGAQGEGEAIFTTMPWVDLVVGPQELTKIPELVLAVLADRKHRIALEMPDKPLLNISAEPRQRDSAITAWVTIIEGCDNFCSYCVVPYVRGRERSRPHEDILREVRDLAAQGYRDVTLLGQNVNSYHDDGFDFPELLELLATHSGMPRLRFVTSHPKDLDDRLIEVMANHDSICEYLHLPVQSGSDTILNAMNRRYTLAHYRRLIDKLRLAMPGICLSTDCIVGFPGETEEDFLQTRSLLTDVQFDLAYMFYYQERAGTAAAKLTDSVPREIKMRRLTELLEIQIKISDISLATNLHKDVEVLIEGSSKRGEGFMTGRTRTNQIVHVPGTDADIGRFITVHIEEILAHSLRGTRISPGE